MKITEEKPTAGRIKIFVPESNLSVIVLEKYLSGMIDQYEKMPQTKGVNRPDGKDLIYDKIIKMQKDINTLKNK